MSVMGVAKIKVDNELVQSEPGATLVLGGEEGEMVSGHAVYGFRPGPVVPSNVQFKVFVTELTPVDKLRKARDVTITFEAPNIGKTWVLTGMNHLKSGEISDSDGTMSCEYGGQPSEEA
jgi:hypothetical protein